MCFCMYFFFLVLLYFYLFITFFLISFYLRLLCDDFFSVFFLWLCIILVPFSVCWTSFSVVPSLSSCRLYLDFPLFYFLYFCFNIIFKSSLKCELLGAFLFSVLLLSTNSFLLHPPSTSSFPSSGSKHLVISAPGCWRAPLLVPNDLITPTPPG